MLQKWSLKSLKVNKYAVLGIVILLQRIRNFLLELRELR